MALVIRSGASQVRSIGGKRSGGSHQKPNSFRSRKSKYSSIPPSYSAPSAALISATVLPACSVRISYRPLGMNWNDCRCTSQRRLRRAPFTGRQHAKSWKTGARTSDLIVRTEAPGDRLAEAAADVADGAVGAAFDQPQHRGARGAGVEEPVAYGRDLPPLGGEPREELAFMVVVHGLPSAGGAARSCAPVGSCRGGTPCRAARPD